MSPYFHQWQSSSTLPFQPTTSHNSSLRCQVDARISSVFLSQVENIIWLLNLWSLKSKGKKAIELIIIESKWHAPLIDTENCWLYHSESSFDKRENRSSWRNSLRAGKGGYGFGHHCHCTSFVHCPYFYGYYSFNSDIDESVSFKPGTLSQGDVPLIAHELSSSWKMVGRVLKVPDAVIDQIEANTFEDSEKCDSECDGVVCI